MKMKSGFRNTQWDPILLFAQIVAIQSILYVTLGCIIAFMDVFVDANHTLDHLFQYHVSRIQNLIFVRVVEHYESFVCFFVTGNSCDRFGWTFRHPVICVECIYRCIGSTLHRRSYEIMFGF